MSERVSSLLILIGGGVVLLALWALSVLLVRRDTHRRSLSDLEQKAWLGLSILLPLFGFALYLAVYIMRRYLAAPLPARDDGEDARLTAVKARAQPGQNHPPVQPGPRNEPELAWRQPPAGRTNGAQAPHAAGQPPTAVAVAQQPLSVGYALAVLKGPHLGQQFILNQLPVRIGRGPDVSISLDADLNVSRNHAEIYEWNGRMRIRDLHSSHGTGVNEQLAVDQALLPGDRISVGSTVLIVREIN